MYYITLRFVSVFTIFFHITQNETIFRQNDVNKMPFFKFCPKIRSATFFLRRIQLNIYINVCLYVIYPPLLTDFRQARIFFTTLEKFSNIKYFSNSSNRSRVVRCERTGGRTAITNLIVNFRKSAKYLI
jgi:hypothetical protein